MVRGAGKINMHGRCPRISPLAPTVWDQETAQTGLRQSSKRRAKLVDSATPPCQAVCPTKQRPGDTSAAWLLVQRAGKCFAGRRAGNEPSCNRPANKSVYPPQEVYCKTVTLIPILLVAPYSPRAVECDLRQFLVLSGWGSRFFGLYSYNESLWRWCLRPPLFVG